MTPGLVSIVIAAHNEEAFITEALQTVHAQTYKPIEVIVVDDGSEDRTAELAATHNVHLIQQPHLGPSTARNTGLRTAHGEYWTIFDADDLMPPQRIENQVAHLQHHPHHQIVLGLTTAFVTPGEPRPPHYNPTWDNGPFPACAGTLFARRSVLEAVGYYDETISLAYDVEWLARAKDAGVVAGQIDELCLHYRIHSGNTSAQKPAVHQSMLRLLRESIHRQNSSREAPGSGPARAK